MKLQFLTWIACLFFTINTSAQYEDILLEDYVYVTNIKSVALYPNGEVLSPPILYLNNSQGITLSFDDMDNLQKDFTYEIVHCNKDWTGISSELERLEYIDGFVNEEIQDIEFSVNTFVPYINYQLKLPHRQLKWTISGNYLLIVYEGDDVDDRIPVISRRFMVVDRNVSVSVKNRRPLDVSKLRTHYEFDLFVQNKDFNIIDPQNNISVTAMQNYRWDTAIKNINPKFIVGDRMTIDNEGKLSFLGMKEFRSVDIRTLDFTSNGINSIELKEYGTDVLLQLGYVRGDSDYLTIPDANGMFVIQNRDIGGDRTGGDYANVIFTLESPKMEDEVYIAGRFTDWKADEMYRMRYYEDRKVYVGEVQLKQGYYDFFFATERDGKLFPSEIEGSWHETENNYQIFVYLREPADRYDRLVGFYQFNSNDF